MVRNYIRKTQRGAYGNGPLTAALEAIKNGVPVQRAGRQFNIPLKTLRRHRDGKVKKPGFVMLGRYNKNMSRMKARKWVLVHRFEGFPKDSDLQIQEEELPTLVDGDVLLEALYLSVDPYMRAYAPSLPEGSTMIGQQLCRVAQSKNNAYPEGTMLLASVGWRDKTVLNLTSSSMDAKGFPVTLPAVIPMWSVGDFPQSLSLGVLGMPGASAHVGLLKICDPKPGETVFVNSAAGIVGSIAGQIAKIKGCRVIGCAGSDDKCKWLKDELHFDFVFNYKTRNLSEALKEGAPSGIDCYFDNVGGDMSATVIQHHMNRFGRISCCGVLSAYNMKDLPQGPQVFWAFVAKELKMQGFLMSSHFAELPAAITELHQWLKEGKLKYKEEMLNGFENTRAAFYGLLRGDFCGKVVVKA